MTRIAARFGITDVALRKKCARHAVPVPGRGYWQQLEAGKSPTSTLLPNDAGNSRIDFCLLADPGTSLPLHDANLAGESSNWVAVRTRADDLAEARHRAAVKKQRRHAFEDEQRDAHARAVAERKAVERLEADAIAWERAQRLRAYIAAVAGAFGLGDTADDLASWLGWASRQADAIDPLRLGVRAVCQVPAPDRGGAGSLTAARDSDAVQLHRARWAGDGASNSDSAGLRINRAP